MKTVRVPFQNSLDHKFQISHVPMKKIATHELTQKTHPTNARKRNKKEESKRRTPMKRQGLKAHLLLEFVANQGLFFGNMPSCRGTIMLGSQVAHQNAPTDATFAKIQRALVR